MTIILAYRRMVIPTYAPLNKLVSSPTVTFMNRTSWQQASLANMESLALQVLQVMYAQGEEKKGVTGSLEINKWAEKWNGDMASWYTRMYGM